MTTRRWLRTLIPIGLVLGGVVCPAVAQTPVPQPIETTTLTAALDAVSTTVALTSVADIEPGYYLYVDRETMVVQTIVDATHVTVTRAFTGLVATHGNGSTVYFGPVGKFARVPPATSACTVGVTAANYYVNIDAGAIYECVGGAPGYPGTLVSVGTTGIFTPTYTAPPVSYFMSTTGPVFGSTSGTTRLSTSLAAPPVSNAGDVWIECVGTSPTRVCAVKVNDNGTIRVIASITF